MDGNDRRVRHLRRDGCGTSAQLLSVALALAGGGAPACASDLSAGEETGSLRQSALNPNALNPNALNPNALNPNALNPNALNPNALNPNAMSPEAMSSLREPGDLGALSRELVRYAVSCAFQPDQRFEFSWTDADGAPRHETFVGLLGLAPEWATAPLGPRGQRWVSACLGSRVNAMGVSVVLSSRGPHAALATTLEERVTYESREGAFYGNLFAGGFVHVCYDPANVTAGALKDRMCAQATTGLTEPDRCGAVKIDGPCGGVAGVGLACEGVDLVDLSFRACSADGVVHGEVITTFLDIL